jgi:hypothetical protein
MGMTGDGGNRGLVTRAVDPTPSGRLRVVAELLHRQLLADGCSLLCRNGLTRCVEVAVPAEGRAMNRGAPPEGHLQTEIAPVGALRSLRSVVCSLPTSSRLVTSFLPRRRPIACRKYKPRRVPLFGLARRASQHRDAGRLQSISSPKRPDFELSRLRQEVWLGAVQSQALTIGRRSQILRRSEMGTFYSTKRTLALSSVLTDGHCSPSFESRTPRAPTAVIPAQPVSLGAEGEPLCSLFGAAGDARWRLQPGSRTPVTGLLVFSSLVRGTSKHRSCCWI